MLPKVASLLANAHSRAVVTARHHEEVVKRRRARKERWVAMVGRFGAYVAVRVEVGLCRLSGDRSLPSLWRSVFAVPLEIGLCRPSGDRSLPSLWRSVFAVSLSLSLFLWRSTSSSRLPGPLFGPKGASALSRRLPGPRRAWSNLVSGGDCP
jgi:hypothetical protein